MENFNNNNNNNNNNSNNNNNNKKNIFIQGSCISIRNKMLSMQVLLLKTKKDKKTDNNAIYKLKKINASA